MIMGNKIVKIEDSFISIGGYILSLLHTESMSVDKLYMKFKEIYPKREISFDSFIYTLDFLYMINKIKIKKDDTIEALR